MSVKRISRAALSALISLGAWELLGRWGVLNPFVLPAPSALLHSLREEVLSGRFFADAGWSLGRVFLGFLLAVGLATPLGLAIGASPKVRDYADPFLQFLRPIPPVAWIPLSILWFGLGNGPPLFLTFVASFFPICLSTAQGVISIHPRHLEVARCLEAPRAMVFRRIILPGALPQILTGYRIGFGVAWMAVVAAEMIAARTGLGHLIHVSQDVLRTDLVMVGMVGIGLLGLLFDVALRALQRRLVPWEVTS